jgi:4-methyl-5(b-hydroxyethyl)-thiazole monophosphate biosynthesis
MPDDRYLEQRVVRGDRILTSRGPGTAMEFAFALVREMWGEDAVKEVNAGVLAVL